MGLPERKRFKKIREYVIERDGSICCYCDKVLTEQSITLDHIVPDSKRGTFNTTNLTVACAKCNNKRGNRLFFEFCKHFNWPQDKINKYKKLYLSNLYIKVLNIAKEECMKSDLVIPNSLINEACDLLRTKKLDFSNYEKEYFFTIKFDEICERRRVKYCFEQLIRVIEAESR